MEVGHIGVWVKNLEAMRRFYEEILGGRAGRRYQNPKTGFSSYFVRFGPGAAVELMHRGDIPAADASAADTSATDASAASDEAAGYAHIAFEMGTRAQVDAVTRRLEALGLSRLSGPRVTGDGYYESCFADPEGNRLEFTADAVSADAAPSGT